MKIEIMKGKDKVIIDLVGLKGKHINSLIDKQIEMQKAKDDNTEIVIKTKEYLQELENIASIISNLTHEELNELDIDEKLKIVNFIIEKTKNSVGF